MRKAQGILQVEPEELQSRTPTLRGEAWLNRLNRYTSKVENFVARHLSHEVNPILSLGQAANASLVIAVVTGVLLLIWYSPSSQFAYSSLSVLDPLSIGGIVRTAHRYSSDLLMLFLLLHAARMLLAGKFAGPRWLAWVTGVALAALIWFIGWTGYWLVWDQAGQQIAITSMEVIDSFGIFGEPMGRFFLADRLVPSLLFFVVFFLHMLLPLGIAVGLVAHLLRLSRVRLFPGWKQFALLALVVVLASVIYPAPLGDEAQMDLKPEALTVDAWYMTPLALGLRFQGPGLWVSFLGILAVSGVLPWLLARKDRTDTFRAAVEVGRCHGCTQCFQDCPFDAISMLPRSDGKAFESEAWVDPARCIGCGVCAGSCDSEGIGLSWFPTSQEEGRMEKRFFQEIAAAKGSEWIALVGSDIEGSAQTLDAKRWRKRLRGYQVFMIPTASWVRPQWVERLLKKGAKGVLIVRGGGIESKARDGENWVSDRLQGLRNPRFRENRAAGSDNWRVLDFQPSAVKQFEKEAEGFKSGAVSGEARKSWTRAAAVGVALFFGLGLLAVAPSRLVVSNPASLDAEIVFSFKVEGALLEEPKEFDPVDEGRPVHMQGRSYTKPRREAVAVRLMVGDRVVAGSFKPKGFSDDGPSIGVMRMPVGPGEHTVRIEVDRGGVTDLLIWQGSVAAEIRRLNVITLDRSGVFTLE